MSSSPVLMTSSRSMFVGTTLDGQPAILSPPMSPVKFKRIPTATGDNSPLRAPSSSPVKMDLSPSTPSAFSPRGEAAAYAAGDPDADAIDEQPLERKHARSMRPNVVKRRSASVPPLLRQSRFSVVRQSSAELKFEDTSVAMARFFRECCVRIDALPLRGDDELADRLRREMEQMGDMAESVPMDTIPQVEAITAMMRGIWQRYDDAVRDRDLGRLAERLRLSAEAKESKTATAELPPPALKITVDFERRAEDRRRTLAEKRKKAELNGRALFEPRPSSRFKVSFRNRLASVKDSAVSTSVSPVADAVSE